MSEEHRCPMCNAPFWYLIGASKRMFECGSYTQFPSMACRYASQLQERIKRLEEAGDALFENSTPSRYDLPAAADRKLVEQSNWTKAKEAKP